MEEDEEAEEEEEEEESSDDEASSDRDQEVHPIFIVRWDRVFLLILFGQN